MRKLLFAALLLFILNPLTAEQIGLGYEVSSRGYNRANLTEKECVGLQVLYAVPSLPLILHLGIALPLGGEFRQDMIVSSDIEIAPIVLQDHPFRHFFTLPGFYAPALRLGVLTDIKGMNRIELFAELHPFRFAVGGGYTSVLAPGILIDPREQSEKLISGWQLSLFTIGFYLW